VGCYDYIESEMLCIFCNNKTKLSEQIKWSSQNFNKYKIGDYIDKSIDGDYFHGSSVRDLLWNYCENCGKKIIYGVRVENNIFKEIIINNEEYYKNGNE